MHEFSSSVNKVNKAVAKVRTIGDRLPLNCQTSTNNVNEINFTCITLRRNIEDFFRNEHTKLENVHIPVSGVIVLLRYCPPLNDNKTPCIT